MNQVIFSFRTHVVNPAIVTEPWGCRDAQVAPWHGRMLSASLERSKTTRLDVTKQRNCYVDMQRYILYHVMYIDVL